MQYEPPIKPIGSDEDVVVAIPVDGSPQHNPNLDGNGILLGQWKTGICGCVDSLVPNAFMSCLCTGIAVGQITARLGLMDFKTVVSAFGLVALVSFIAAVTTSAFFDWLSFLMSVACALWMTRLRGRIRALFQIPGSVLDDLLYSCCCGCCSVAQMATHVGAYQAGSCGFAPRSTLEGYSF